MITNAFDCFHVLNKNSGHHFGSAELYDIVRERDIDASSETIAPFPQLWSVGHRLATCDRTGAEPSDSAHGDARWTLFSFAKVYGVSVSAFGVNKENKGHHKVKVRWHHPCPLADLVPTSYFECIALVISRQDVFNQPRGILYTILIINYNIYNQ